MSRRSSATASGRTSRARFASGPARRRSLIANALAELRGDRDVLELGDDGQVIARAPRTAAGPRTTVDELEPTAIQDVVERNERCGCGPRAREAGGGRQ